ncbi:cytohesin-3 isoform X9 [Syngnathus scovelli]|uniref:cytohesin-3 isoform X9 n=1 Tax=Syngnathus scovelli TaxID=161590 RepID=UPI00210F2996|nr:cytohesin-3 isoform X9 [Syngnathus scovelli]
MDEDNQVPEDLSSEERDELCNIHRRKKELLDDIERLKFEIAEVMTEIEQLTCVGESKSTQRNKQMAMGRKKFNMDPKKGIRFLLENDLLHNTPGDIAQFLYKGEGLNKTVIGDYLGERDDFNIKVLQVFVELHEFADLNLVQALRQFLWSFRLPGEAQKIDRMMEAFASRYCQCNPGVFQSTDTCYVLSFAIIMLNTSLHNPNVRDKPPAERFISMNRGINEGGDLPEELLRNLYESIKSEPFKIPEDDGNDLTHTFFNPDREGWLLKLGGRVKTWKRRWFILTDNCLYYFEYTTDKEPRGIIPLENLSIREVEEPRKPNCFELYNPSHKGQVIKACKTEADGRVVEGNHVVYRISAPTPEEKEEWIKSIKAPKQHLRWRVSRRRASLPPTNREETMETKLGHHTNSPPWPVSAGTPSTTCWPPGKDASPARSEAYGCKSRQNGDVFLFFGGGVEVSCTWWKSDQLYTHTCADFLHRPPPSPHFTKTSFRCTCMWGI